MTDALAVRKLTAGYGGHTVLEGLDLALRKGTVLCLAGHNGAGKSTLMKLLFGLLSATAGDVLLDGQMVRPNPAAMAKAGVALVPEGRGVFPGLTVAETFALAGWSAALKGGELAARTDEVLTVLPVLRDVWRRRAGQLSGGQQQMVSIGRALLSRPAILLLDEPSIGLAPKLFQDLLAPIRALQQARGMSILLVEQNIHEAFAVSDYVAVMKSGRIIFEGVPADLSDHAKLMELF
jgi:ABC-type branched-subunit amino acid transport system ATPase component